MGDDSLFWLFKLDFCLLDLELFHLNISGSNLETDHSCLFWEHHGRQAGSTGPCESDFSDCCFDSAVH